MLLNIIGRLLYWAAKALQLTSVRYCEKRKRYVQHRFLYYNIFVTLVKIALLSIDIPDVVLIGISIHRLKFVEDTSIFLVLGQCVLWLSRLYALMALICLTHLSYYQRRVAAILNKILDISRELENCYFADNSESSISCLLLILLVLAIARLMSDIWTKLSMSVYLSSYVYYNTLFSIWYLVVAVYQTKLIEWRREMVLFLNEFHENEGYRSKTEVDQLLTCLHLNYSILKLQMSFYKIWNSFSCILSLLLWNFINLWNMSSAMHFVSVLILCHISDEGRRLENQFLDLLCVTSLRSSRGDKMVSNL